MRPARASRKREVSSSACDRRSSAQTCTPPTRLTMSRPISEKSPAPPWKPGIISRTVFADAGPILVTVTWSVCAGPGPGLATAKVAAATARSEGMGREPTMGGVAVLIASDLSKDMAGEPLLRGVSLKLERRDRVTIAGRNGAGKTTLLRMLAGETSIDGGELVLAKNTRMALHDQRPPRERDLSLRDYVLSACKEPLELEAGSGPRSTGWPAATTRRCTATAT